MTDQQKRIEEGKTRIAIDAQVYATEPAFSGGFKVNRTKQIGYVAGGMYEMALAESVIESQSKELTRLRSLNEELTAWKESAIKSSEYWDKIIDFAQASKLFKAGDHIPTKTIKVIERLSSLNEAAEKVIESALTKEEVNDMRIARANGLIKPWREQLISAIDAYETLKNKP